MRFAASGRSSIGVELELYCVDPATGRPVGRAQDLLAALRGGGEDRGEDRGERVKGEFLTNTIEVVSEPRVLVRDAVADVRDGLRSVLAAAGELGIGIGTSGTHPTARWREQEFDDTRPQYAAIADRIGPVVRQTLIWGLHVHVGVESGDKVVPLMQRLAPLVPAFIALSASSPFWESTVTGYASYRTLVFDRLPNAGPAPRLRDWADYEQLVGAMTASGSIADLRELWWDLRPAAHLGTLELRVFDAVPRLDDLAALVALAQCAVELASREIDDGVAAPQAPA